MRPIAHRSGQHKGEVILRCKNWWEFSASNRRLCWHWCPYNGELSSLPKQCREVLIELRGSIDVALKRAAGRAT